MVQATAYDKVMHGINGRLLPAGNFMPHTQTHTHTLAGTHMKKRQMTMYERVCVYLRVAIQACVSVCVLACLFSGLVAHTSYDLFRKQRTLRPPARPPSSTVNVGQSA